MEHVPFKFPTGEIRILRCDKQELYSFLDYISNGLEIALSIAVDFTLSNGEPSNPASLHYFDLYKNQYLQAITSVGQILENYDSDKNFSLFGFGARVPFLMDKTSHCFALDGDIFHPEVKGIQGVVEGNHGFRESIVAYKNALKIVKLNGPTYFSKLIGYMCDMVEYEVKICGYFKPTHCVRRMNKYYILLVLTDGLINDQEDTIDQIVRATALPLSIIIVGVGDEDFSAMHM